ncbi:tetratricopeptide repeat protein [Pontixanthobacter gangjinensis]|uniref:Tetratricopeptide repeat protein n=1 Tax=Christiangramia aestuarii TaxID=1028746 RepID=A0A7K1LNQ6_9FLAO|nr:tetratricopeptide repeat protein [Christiangramia aestuarii]MUP42445.1 tetratricopeptide repeat protein [Christiangramia aestuarii]
MRCFLFIALWFLAGCGAFAQSEQLARNFFDQGEYEKALKIYERLYQENPSNPLFFNGLVASHQQLEQFDIAESLLMERLNRSANNPAILIELGHNFELQEQEARAEQFYEEALQSIEGRPNYAYSIARSFEQYNLLEYAAKAYERAMEMNTDRNFNLQLARIYGEQGKIEEMFSNYLDLIENDMKFYGLANREFNRYITEDASAEPNIILRKLLLKKLQEDPQLLYNEMLSWLFIQQKEFDKAFAQERAIYKRGENNLQGILNLAFIAREAEDYAAAKEIVNYAVEESPSPIFNLQARHFLVKLQLETANPEDYPEIENSFRQLIQEYPLNEGTLDLKIDYANFLAFQLDKKQDAIALLKEAMGVGNSDFQTARIKMALADILVVEEKFNEALIYYSQVQNLVKNDEMAQNARFKVAKTSYYKGDFEWAKTQLDILKSSTSQLIANDAMELSLLISDNTQEDSTQTALKKYARADLLSFQKKNPEAIQALDSILVNHKGEKIEDEALLSQAKLFEQEKNYEKAEHNYLAIINSFGKDILADNAHYFLAELYANELHDLEKAKGFYEQIIFNFADSIYFVEARKKYRMLRGDTIE